MARKMWLPVFLSLLTFVNLTTVILNRPRPALAQEGVTVQTGLGTAFTYQGRLTESGGAVNGAYGLQARLFDAATGGAQIGNTVTFDDFIIANGLFSVSLDFGANAFTGQARWLELQVRPGGVGGAYTTLTPRQLLTATPYSLFSGSAGALNGYTVSSTAPTSDQVLKWDGSQWSPQPLGVTMSFAQGVGNNPFSSLTPIGPQATVTVASGQKVLVTANKAVGTIAAGGGAGLSLWICYKQIPNGSLTQVGSGVNGLRVPQNTRAIFGLSAVLEGLNGTYEVGLCGYSTSFASWNDNGVGYTTALLSN